MKKYYGIKLDGKTLGFKTCSNGGGFCVGVEYSLATWSDTIWLLPDRRQVEHVMYNDTPWYNAGMTSPGNGYIGKNLELFEVEI